MPHAQLYSGVFQCCCCCHLANHGDNRAIPSPAWEQLAPVRRIILKLLTDGRLPEIARGCAGFFASTSLRLSRDENTGLGKDSNEIMTPPPEPRSRRSFRLENRERNYASNDFRGLHADNKRSLEKKSKLVKEFSDDSSEYDEELTQNRDESWDKEETRFLHAQSRSRTASPERRKDESESKKSTKSESKRSKNSSFVTSVIPHLSIVALILLVTCVLCLKTNRKHSTNGVQHVDNPDFVLVASIEKAKEKFCNQESDIWNDISSAINEMLWRTPKVPSIILLYANETDTLNCLASEIARVSSTVLRTEGIVRLNPRDFGNDSGKVITMMKKRLPAKKVAIFHDILDINANAIRALHFLCDRVNPLIGEVIYILTMQTGNQNPSQKNMMFVEKHLYQKFSGSIDGDILTALVTRITDGSIISVKPEPNLRYCT